MRTAIALIGVVAPCLALAAAPAKPKIAVLGVRAESGVEQGVGNVLSELMASDVENTHQYDVITSKDIATMIGFERQRQMMGCNQNDNCFIELGQALGTDLILDASVGTVGSLRVLAVRLYDTNKSRAVARESITVNDEAALVDAAHLAVARVLGLHIPAAGGPNGEPAAGVSASSRKFPVGWAVLGGGAVLAAVGAVFGGLALSDYNAYKANPFDETLGGAAKSKAYVADGLYVGALVVAAVGVILLVVMR